MSEQVEVPQSFICPLSYELMDDPVQDREGNSYERKWIVEWLKQKKESPLTRSHLEESHLVPNRALKEAIEEFKKQNPNYKILSKPEARGLQPPPPPLPLIHIPLQVQAYTTSVADPEAAEYTLIKVTTSESAKRVPVHICCIVDISGSMGSMVEVKTSSGALESNGLSRLDLVKHALNTIVHALKEYDSLTLVTFTDDAQVIFSGMQIIEGNKRLILEQIKELSPQNGTNLWAGLKLGVEVMSKCAPNNQVRAIYMLTDGEPSDIPPRGHEYELERLLKSNPCNCPINSFGFGYDLDSKLLRNLSNIGHGVYSFIPDGTFVGTIFINALSMLFTTIAVKAIAILTQADGTKLTLDMESILFEQNRTALVKKSSKSIEIQYIDPFQNKEEKIVLDSVDAKEFPIVEKEFYFHKIRNDFSEILFECMEAEKGEKLKAFVENYNLPKFKVDGKVDNLLKDATGQATQAFSREDWFNRWGKHYVPSLASAHSLQLCNNFKDPGVQNYAGELFEKLRDELNDIFMKLPPPEPSIPIDKSGGPVSMSQYNNPHGVCFAGTSSVQMDAGTKLVRDIRVGDTVKLPNQETAKVTHIVKTRFPDGVANLVKFESGLIITPWHPMRVNNNWTFPIDLKSPELMDCSEVFSFALDKGHVMSINGMECVALGHNFQEAVVRHEYFGSSKILKDLDAMPKDKDLVITIRKQNIVRDPTSGLICGIKPC